MTSPLSRRTFVQSTLAAGATAAIASAAGAQDAEPKKVVVGVMGVGRGSSLARTFASQPGVEVRYLCDVDANRLAGFAASLKENVDYEVKTTGDFHDILADKEVDALVCAAPNHWHAPAGILACTSGKHAYVEKPCSHNPAEGEMLVEAARKHKRCVQMGNQRRSCEALIKAVKLLHDGAIGDVYYSRSWYANRRGSIGEGKPAEVPENLDYDMWQGPAPRQPYTTNRLHYDWHWVWHYGNGELGNNGVHSLDLSRWGLDVGYPTRVVSSGGRYAFNDDQETADTHVVSFEFDGGKQIIWEGISCNGLGLYNSGFGATFHGKKGSMKMDSWGYTLYDAAGKEIEKDSSGAADSAHIANFIAAIRADDPKLLNSEIEEGHKSTLLCHLGNIAHRTGDTLHCDSSNGHVKDNDAAMKLWQREYEAGWEPKI